MVTITVIVVTLTVTVELVVEAELVVAESEVVAEAEEVEVVETEVVEVVVVGGVTPDPGTTIPLSDGSTTYTSMVTPLGSLKGLYVTL